MNGDVILALDPDTDPAERRRFYARATQYVRDAQRALVAAEVELLERQRAITDA